MGFKTYLMKKSLKCLKLPTNKEILYGQILHSFAATIGHYFLQNGELAPLKFDNIFYLMSVWSLVHGEDIISF